MIAASDTALVRNYDSVSDWSQESARESQGDAQLLKPRMPDSCYIYEILLPTNVQRYYRVIDGK